MAPLPPIQAVIFDCDGVMFDTVAANKAYYNQILQQFGRPPMTPAQFAYCHMHTGDNALAHLFGDDAPQLQAAQDYRRQMGYGRFIHLMEIEPHLLPLVRALRPRIKTAIATNRADTMEEVMQVHGLVDEFDLVVTSRDVVNPKPAPDVLVKVLAHFALTPAEALYVGDSSVDEQAAAAVGIPLVAYRNPELKARFHIAHLDEVRPLVGNAAGA
jgi:phosphoglycolate phosphatase